MRCPFLPFSRPFRQAPAGRWALIGVCRVTRQADLFNEPHKARWDDGGAKLDWAAAAERIGRTASSSRTDPTL
jgi:hypothetical protein